MTEFFYGQTCAKSTGEFAFAIGTGDSTASMLPLSSDEIVLLAE